MKSIIMPEARLILRPVAVPAMPERRVFRDLGGGALAFADPVGGTVRGFNAVL